MRRWWIPTATAGSPRRRGTRSRARASRFCIRVIPAVRRPQVAEPWARRSSPGRRTQSEARHAGQLQPLRDSEPGRRFGVGRLGALSRVSRAPRSRQEPAAVRITEVYKVPEPGFDPRGVDIDTNGVVWTALAASSHMASFDRRKCKALPDRARPTAASARGLDAVPDAGPEAEGHQHPGRLPLLQLGGPAQHPRPGAEQADGHRLELGLRSGARSADAPLGHAPRALSARFYSRGLDGRIDDPNGGWKGRALYANYGTHFVWHIEGGKGTRASW